MTKAISSSLSLSFRRQVSAAAKSCMLPSPRPIHDMAWHGYPAGLNSRLWLLPLPLHMLKCTQKPSVQPHSTPTPTPTQTCMKSCIPVTHWPVEAASPLPSYVFTNWPAQACSTSRSNVLPPFLNVKSLSFVLS